jgi:hypothetical protein
MYVEREEGRWVHLLYMYESTYVVMSIHGRIDIDIYIHLSAMVDARLSRTGYLTICHS